MKQYLIFATLWHLGFCVPATTYAQIQERTQARTKFYFSLSAGVLQSFAAARPTTQQTNYYTSYIEPNTNKQFEIRYPAEYQVEYIFNGKPGGFLEGTVHLPIGSSLALKTGVGMQWDRFSYQKQFGAVNLGEPTDTTVRFAQTETPIVIYKVNYDINTIQNINYELLQMRLPLLLEYRTPINVSVEAGAFLQALLWSESSSYATDFRLEQERLPDGKLQYTYYFDAVAEKKRPAPNLAGTTAGWQLGLNYRLRQWALEASYAQTFLNAFTQKEDELFLSPNYRTYDADVTFRYIRVGLCYFL